MFGSTLVLAQLYKQRNALAQREYSTTHAHPMWVYRCSLCRKAVEKQFAEWLHMAILATDMSKATGSPFVVRYTTGRNPKPYCIRVGA